MTLHYSHCTTPQLQLHYTNYTTLQLQLQLRYTTLHPAGVGEVTAATIATTPKNTTPSTFRSISGLTLPSMHHNNSPLLQCPIFETSATALRGTTGILGKMAINQWRFGRWYPSFVEKTVLHDVSSREQVGSNGWGLGCLMGFSGIFHLAYDCNGDATWGLSSNIAGPGWSR